MAPTTLYGKLKISTILDSESLETVMKPTGGDPMPILRFDPTHLTTSKSPNVAVLRAWKRRNADARCTIITGVCDSVLTVVQHTTKAHEAWSILASQHEIGNYTRIQNLENELVVERVIDGAKAESFVKRIKDLQGIRLFDAFEYFLHTLNTQVWSTPLKFDELSAMLLEEELRLKTSEGRFSVCHRE